MNKKFRKCLCAAIAGAILLTSSVGTSVTAYADSTSTSVSQTKTFKIAHKKVKTYLFKSTPEYTTEMPVYFFDSGTIPYFKVEDFASLYRTAMIMCGLTDFDF